MSDIKIPRTLVPRTRTTATPLPLRPLPLQPPFAPSSLRSPPFARALPLYLFPCPSVRFPFLPHFLRASPALPPLLHFASGVSSGEYFGARAENQVSADTSYLPLSPSLSRVGPLPLAGATRAITYIRAYGAFVSRANIKSSAAKRAA